MKYLCKSEKNKRPKGLVATLKIAVASGQEIKIYRVMQTFKNTRVIPVLNKNPGKTTPDLSATSQTRALGGNTRILQDNASYDENHSP